MDYLNIWCVASGLTVICVGVLGKTLTAHHFFVNTVRVGFIACSASELELCSLLSGYCSVELR
jgi:hypothetical protein